MQTARTLYQTLLTSLLLSGASVGADAQTGIATLADGGSSDVPVSLASRPDGKTRPNLSSIYSLWYDGIPLEVVDESEGAVGQRLVYHVRERFRQSASFRVTAAAESRLQVYVATMPRFEDRPYEATMYSVVWVLKVWTGAEWRSMYIHHTLGYAGSDVVVSSAETIVSSTDQLMAAILLLYAAGY